MIVQGFGEASRSSISVAMLACTRIGAIHSVVFGGFSPDALAGRIQDCDSNCVITADERVAVRTQG